MKSLDFRTVLFGWTVMSMVVAGAASCSKDDDTRVPLTTEESKLVGMWYNFVGTGYGGYGSHIDYYYKYVFRSDRSYEYRLIIMPDIIKGTLTRVKGKFSVSGNKISFSDNTFAQIVGVDEYTRVHTISDSNADKLLDTQTYKSLGYNWQAEYKFLDDGNAMIGILDFEAKKGTTESPFESGMPPWTHNF